MNKFVFAAIFGLLAVVSGCKPRPVQGQAFIVEPSGVGQPLDGLQIIVVDAAQADEFIQQKASQYHSQRSQLQHQLAALEAKLQADQIIESNNEIAVNSQSPTNDIRYINKLRECTNDVAEAEKLSKAVQYLQSKYGERPELFVQRFPQAYYDAWSAEQQDADRIQEISRKVSAMADWEQTFFEGFDTEQSNQISVMREKLKEEQDSINQVQNELASLNTAQFYLSGFQPNAIQIVLADINGNFEIPTLNQNEKVFAKLILPDSTAYFWLVKPPQAGQKLILSNGNQFTPPP